VTSTLSPARAAGLSAGLAIGSALLSNFAPLEPWGVLQIGPRLDAIPLLPGIYFGLVVCVGGFLTGTRNPLSLALLLAMIVVAWVCAWKTGYQLYERLERDHPGPIGSAGASVLAPARLAITGLVAGLVGSAITVLGVIIVRRDFRSVANCARTIAIGTAAGTLLACNSVIESMLPLFLVWQPAVAASIAFGLARPKPRPAAPTIGGSAPVET